MVRRPILFAALLWLVIAAPGPAAAAQECDAACLSDLREKVIRDLRALNDGEVWA